MIIPHNQLDPETLQNLLEEYATRDGTDYGEQEVSLENKVASLRRQLEKKTVVIWFEPGEESVNLILAEDIPRDGDY
ncbi:YheU family protein [Microbulbifer harenosus]|uniref:YheU family protein n=1 Tax=Microbulbifer harenosus TaxID=2576840 RepID=A0ABY2UHY7_9GAMM|nr:MULTISPECIES: YheU family protein [Microbulbifer]QIL88831.1 YheU family protein [Microbulbifer sp. SH-1]TLM77568.1 YheU family protein [Microbulbifer harenosus]